MDPTHAASPQDDHLPGQMSVLPREDASRAIELALVGLAAGLLGSLAMNVYSRVVRSEREDREAPGAAPGVDRDGRGMQPPQARGRAEKDASVRMGSAVYRAVAGHDPDPITERRLGTAAHYAFGATAGVIYTLASEQMPALRKGFGTFYGALVWAIADEGVVPALGLSRGPQELPAAVHAYSLTGHGVYGATLECVRRIINH